MGNYPLLKNSMEPTDFSDSVCRVSDWVEGDFYSASAYRIWLCRSGYHWFQRHEWARSRKNSSMLDEWVYSGYSRAKEFPESFLHDGIKMIKELEI